MTGVRLTPHGKILHELADMLGAAAADLSRQVQLSREDDGFENAEDDDTNDRLMMVFEQHVVAAVCQLSEASRILRAIADEPLVAPKRLEDEARRHDKADRGPS